MTGTAAAAATGLATVSVRRALRPTSRLANDSAAVMRSSGPAGVPVVLSNGAVAVADRKPVTAAVGRASATGTVAVAAARLIPGVARTASSSAGAGSEGAVNSVAAGASVTSGSETAAFGRDVRLALRCATAAPGRFRVAAPRRDARSVGAVSSPARAAGESVEAEGEAESSAEATKGTVLTMPPMPRAIARAPTRPMYLDDFADNMVNLPYGFWLRV